jgi:hypothetical protein
MCFKHLKEQNIGYCQHFRQAFWIAWELTKCIPKVMIHGFWPDAYDHTATDKCKEIIEKAYPGTRVVRPGDKKPY